MQSWEYVALCLLLPLVWGVASARVFDWLAARREARGELPIREDDELYYI